MRAMISVRRAWPRQRLTFLVAATTGCLLAGCQAGGSAPAAAASGTPATAASAAAPPPIAVTVTPAVLAPGAVRVGLPTPTVLAAPTPARRRIAPPTGSFVVTCASYPSPKQISLRVTPGSGSARVAWRSDGDASVHTYRVSAVSQRLVGGTQPAHPTATVPRGPGCGPLSATVAGLSHGVDYVFWLEEGTTDPATGTLRYTLVGQSAGVLIP